MKDKEKILVSAFFDGELVGDEKKEAENLIAKNSEAYEYFQSLKLIDNDLRSHINLALESEKVKDAIDFVVNEGKEKSVSSGFFKKFFSPSALGSISLTSNKAGLAFSFAMIFSVGFISNQFIFTSKDGSIDLNLDGFVNQSFITKNVIKTRSSFSTDDFEDNVKNLIEEMISEKTLNGRLNYGAESFIIFLEKSFKGPRSINYSCFEGIIKESNGENGFVFCKSANSSSLLVTN